MTKHTFVILSKSRAILLVGGFFYYKGSYEVLGWLEDMYLIPRYIVGRIKIIREPRCTFDYH